jgi:hypothetical protein
MRMRRSLARAKGYRFGAGKRKLGTKKRIKLAQK